MNLIYLSSNTDSGKWALLYRATKYTKSSSPPYISMDKLVITVLRLLM